MGLFEGNHFHLVVDSITRVCVNMMLDYLNCPFCPAQSYPAKKQDDNRHTVYVCSAQHTFLIKVKEEKASEE